MHVLMLTTHLDTGGITSYILTLSQGLVQNGCRVTVVSNGGSKQSAFEAVGVKVLVRKIRTKSELNPRLYWSLPSLARYIRQEKVNVIHAHTRIAQVMGFLLGRLTSVAYVATCHGFYKPRWFRRVFPCWGHNVIAISPAVAEHLEHDFGIAKDRIFQIKHGINVEDFPLVNSESRLRQRRAYGISGTPAIGIIARLADVKGHDVLIRAMPAVLRDYPQAQLIIVGEGKQEPALRQLVSHLQLEKHIQFFPAINRTTEFLPAFDIFVMPSLSEGFGLSMIEAMAVGVPVVASRVGGIPSFIRNEETGLLVEPRHHEDLARNICRLLDEPQLAAGIMTAGRQLIEREYSAEQMVQQTLEVYRLTYEQYSRPQR